jgi:Dioxygenases related to 2-nitropropane dioxygenase
MKTDLCHTLGIEHPIIAAPMGPDISGPELVAAVSNAGGLGILQAQLHSPPRFREEIRRVRTLTAKPFGVNLLLQFPVEVTLSEELLRIYELDQNASPTVERIVSSL